MTSPMFGGQNPASGQMDGQNLSGHLSTISEFSSDTASARSRLQSLYSDIVARKELNPAGFHANVAWWRRLLEGALRQGLLPGKDHLVLHVNDSLLEALRWNPLGRPLAIPSVLAELVHSGVLQSLPVFMDSSSSSARNVATSVMSYLISQPINWALGRHALSRASDASVPFSTRWDSVRGSYVVKSNVEEYAQRIVRHVKDTKRSSIIESLFDTESFRAHFGPLILSNPRDTFSELDGSVLLRYLEKDLRAIVVQTEVIKFISDGPNHSSEITEADIGVVKVKAALRTLESQVQEIQSKIDQCDTNAKKHLAKEQKSRALSLLRFKRELNDLLQDRLKSLDNIHAILLKIERAAGDIEILQAYETSTKALKALTQHPTLHLDNIERTMSTLSEALADHADVEDMIAAGSNYISGAVATVIDDDVEAELQELLRDAQDTSLPTPITDNVLQYDHRKPEGHSTVEGLTAEAPATPEGPLPA